MSQGSSAQNRLQSRVARNWGPPGLALAAILVVAGALRVVGIEYGLPFGGLLNPDERSLVPRAWQMVHGGGADPHWFDYPTLVIYVFAPFQAWQGAPSYLTARVVVAVFGLLAVAAAWWLGRRAYGTLAGVVAASAVAVETTHVAYSHMAVTDVPLTVGIGASLALMISGRLEWAGLAAGLATGAKYPGVFLVAPLLVAGWRRWGRLALSIAAGVAGFLATSPYVLVHPHQAVHEALRVQRLARKGWLGFEHDHFALFSFTAKLWHGLGPALLVAAAGLVVALWRRNRADGVLAVFVLVYFADLLTLRAHFDRYVLPLVPALGALAGRLRLVAPVTLLLLVVPLTLSIRDDLRLTRTDTRVVAARWIVGHVPEDSTVAEESSLPALQGHPTLPLLLPGPGRRFDPNRDVARLRARGVAYVVVSGAIADRVLDARDRYPRETRFYLDLRRSARQIYYVGPGHGLAGPWVSVYRL